MTYRWREHVGPGLDFELGYRTREEAQPWIDGDQMRLLGERLEAATRKRIDAEVEEELREALAFAEASPEPDLTELYTDVYDEVQQ